MRVQLWQGYNDSVAFWRGPLVYALRIGEEWRKLKGSEPFADWEVYPTTPWNFGLQVDRSASRAVGAVRIPDSGQSSVFSGRRPHPRAREGPAAAGVDAGKERRGAPAVEPRRVVRAARGPRSRPVRLHKSTSHRIPDAEMNNHLGSVLQFRIRNAY